MEKQTQDLIVNELMEEMKNEGFFSEDKLTIPVAYRTIRRMIEKAIEKVRTHHSKEKSNMYDEYINVMLEKTVGKEKLKEKYIDKNLFSLFDEFNKYASEMEINDFISRVDFIKNNLKQSINDANLRNSLLESLKKTNEFLVKFHVSKIRSDLDNSILSEEEFDKNLQDYITALAKFITIDNVNYEILSMDE